MRSVADYDGKVNEALEAQNKDLANAAVLAQWANGALSIQMSLVEQALLRAARDVQQTLQSIENGTEPSTLAEVAARALSV